MAAGRFRPDLKDPELVAQVFWTAVHGLVSLRLTKAHDPWIKWRPVKQLVRGERGGTCAGNPTLNRHPGWRRTKDLGPRQAAACRPGDRGDAGFKSVGRAGGRAKWPLPGPACGAKGW